VQSNQCCNNDWPNNLFLYWNLVLDHRWINGHTLQWVSDERMGWNNQSSWLFLNSSGHGSYIIPIEELSKGYLKIYFLMVSINSCIINSEFKVQAPLRRLFIENKSIDFVGGWHILHICRGRPLLQVAALN